MILRSFLVFVVFLLVLVGASVGTVFGQVKEEKVTVDIVVGSEGGSPGEIVRVGVRINTHGQEVTTVQVNLTATSGYLSSVSIVRGEAVPADWYFDSNVVSLEDFRVFVVDLSVEGQVLSGPLFYVDFGILDTVNSGRVEILPTYAAVIGLLVESFPVDWEVGYLYIGGSPTKFGLPPESIELPSFRSEGSKRFLNSDGSLTTVFVDGLHYEKSPGKWEEVSFDFKSRGAKQVMDTNPVYESDISELGLDIVNKKTRKGIRWYTTDKLVVGNLDKASYTKDGLTWTFQNRREGVKTTAVVAVSRGIQTYSFTYMMLGGAKDLVIDEKGNVVGEGFIIPRTTVLGSDGKVYDGGSWSIVPGPRLSFTFDDSGIPTPYIIDPSTDFQPGSAGYDSVLEVRFPNSNYGNDTNMYLGDEWTGGNEAWRPITKFDLSSIDPGDIVNAATLTLYEQLAGSSGGPATRDANLYRVRTGRDWTEDGVTWNRYASNQNWTTGGADDTTSDRVGTSSGVVNLDDTWGHTHAWTSATLVADVQGFVDGSYDNYGWVLIAATAENLGTNTAYNVFDSSDTATSSRRPKLTVNHLGVTLSGTIGDDASEVDVRAGGGTIVLTLTGDTWLDPITAQRQAIINGLDSAQSESTGWNTVVRDTLDVSAVVLTSATVLTITLPAFSTYSIADTETITITIPEAALNTMAADVVVLDTFDITSQLLVDSVNPGGVWTTETSVSLTITGSSLTTGGSSAVELLKTGQSTVTCTGLSGGGTTLTATCNTTGMATGNWNVKVTDSGSSTVTLVEGFGVFTKYSSTINAVGSSFNPDFIGMAHSAAPRFTVQEFDYVNGEFEGTVNSPSTIPADAGLAITFSSDSNRLVVGTDDVNNSTVLYVYEFDNTSGAGSIGDSVVPTTGATGSQVNGVDFTSDNNVLGVVIDASPYVIGYNVDTSASISSFFTSLLSDPASLPPGACNTIDFHPDNDYVALSCGTSPYLVIYAFDNDATPAFGAKSANPSSLPSGVATGVRFSADGDYVAISTTSSPYLEVWNFNDTTGAIGDKVSDPVSLPTGAGAGVDFLNDVTTGTSAVAVSHSTSPYITIYPFNLDAGTFGTKLSDPSTLPSGNSTSVRFHPNDDYVLIGSSSSPYINVYNYSGPLTDLYRVYKSTLFFDTSILPDGATVSEANLKLYGSSDDSDTDFLIRVRSLSDLITTPVTGSAFNSVYHTGSFGAINTSSWSTSGYTTIAVTGASTVVDLTGVTSLGLTSERTISNISPSGDEYVTFFLNESSGTSKDPVLEVTYTPAAGDLTASLSTGYHLLELGSDGSTLTVDVDSVNVASGLTTNINDTLGSLSFLLDGVVRYVRYIKQNVEGTQQIWYELNTPPSYYFTDRSGQGNDSVSISFPTDSYALTVSEDPLTNVGDDPELTTAADPSPPSIVGTLPAITDTEYFGQDTGSDVPVFGILIDITEDLGGLGGLGWSTNTLFSTLVLFVGVIAGIGAFIATKQPIIAVAGVLLVMVVGVSADILGAWIAIVYAIVSLSMVGISRSI